MKQVNFHAQFHPTFISECSELHSRYLLMVGNFISPMRRSSSPSTFHNSASCFNFFPMTHERKQKAHRIEGKCKKFAKYFLTLIPPSIFFAIGFWNEISKILHLLVITFFTALTWKIMLGKSLKESNWNSSHFNLTDESFSHSIRTCSAKRVASECNCMRLRCFVKREQICTSSHPSFKLLRKRN